jgi:hypothetical protein
VIARAGPKARFAVIAAINPPPANVRNAKARPQHALPATTAVPDPARRQFETADHRHITGIITIITRWSAPTSGRVLRNAEHRSGVEIAPDHVRRGRTGSRAGIVTNTTASPWDRAWKNIGLGPPPAEKGNIAAMRADRHSRIGAAISVRPSPDQTAIVLTGHAPGLSRKDAADRALTARR